MKLSFKKIHPLIIIPARGGSKGIPFKNIKLLAGKPLICYTIDVAKEIAPNEYICVSTDDHKIIEIVENYGLKVPFIRPDNLASDESTTNDVILNAINFYESIGVFFDVVILLQPTSPIRKASHIKEALQLYNNQLDMVTSVKVSSNHVTLCEENEEGYLKFTFNKKGERRQNLKKYYEYNGSIYIINIDSLKHKKISEFKKVKKYVMDEKYSIDIDTPLDFIIAEQILIDKKGL